MKKYSAVELSKLGWQGVASMLDRKNEKIERKEIIISLMDVRLKDDIEQIEGQAAEIEKQKDYIVALESEQKDYEKTTMRLREELSELNEKADEDFKFIENLEQENSRLKSEIAFLEEKIK